MSPNFIHFLDFSPPCVVNNSTRPSKSTTVPCHPREDSLTLSEWSLFKSNAESAAEEMKQTFTSDKEVFEDSLRLIPKRPYDYSVSSEQDTTFILRDAILTPLQKIMSFFDRNLIFRSSNENVLLKPDLALYEELDSKHVTCCLIEVKSHWAFSSTCNGDLVQAYSMEVKNSQDSNPFTKIGTKVVRAISQLWGYLSVNHLRYGVLTTFNETYFFRRMHQTSNKSELQVTPAIKINGEAKGIFSYWIYFLILLREDFLYSSPFNSPRLKKRKLVKSTSSIYEPILLNLSDIYFDTAVDFGASSHVGSCRINLEECPINLPSNQQYVVKIMDGSKSLNVPHFFYNEIEVYQKLQHLQSLIIPKFLGCIIASEFVYLILLSKHNSIPECFYPTQQFSEELLKAYETLHENGVVHNDVAARNWIQEGNSPMLVDFGCALFYSPSNDLEKGQLNKEAFSKKAVEEKLNVKNELNRLEC